LPVDHRLVALDQLGWHDRPARCWLRPRVT
jgi:hypothetical protein